MTDRELYERAMARLAQPYFAITTETDPSDGGFLHRDIGEPIAALIEAVGSPVIGERDSYGDEIEPHCAVCGDWTPNHAPDCAITALLKAIVGDQG